MRKCEKEDRPPERPMGRVQNEKVRVVFHGRREVGVSVTTDALLVGASRDARFFAEF